MEKVLICPICGGRNVEEAIVIDSGEEIYACRDCNRQVIPLATPQELEEIEANLLRNHSVIEG